MVEFVSILNWFVLYVQTYSYLSPAENMKDYLTEQGFPNATVTHSLSKETNNNRKYRRQKEVK